MIEYSNDKRQRCQFCGYVEEPKMLSTFIGKNKLLCMCPNCQVLHFNEIENLEEDERFVDDITGKSGAILKYEDDESYCLNKNALLRIINRSLTKEEWNILNNKYKSRDFNFELHDDFYDDNGEALQPNNLIEEN